MDYKTFKPNPDLESIVNFYWTLKVPYNPNNKKQKIIPDSFIEMTFNFGDKIKRYTSENTFVTHYNAMVMGQRTKPYYIEPMGNVDTFAICFYPHGFANFVNISLENLVDKEIAITKLFGELPAKKLEQKIGNASNTPKRIKIIEEFLLNKLNEHTTIDSIVKKTVDILISTNGSSSIHTILKQDLSKRRQLERNFKKQIGISPKQLGKVIRLQAALKIMLEDNADNLTNIAYRSDYFDQAHFIKDFKKFIGTTPKDFLKNENMMLSSLFYKQ